MAGNTQLQRHLDLIELQYTSASTAIHSCKAAKTPQFTPLCSGQNIFPYGPLPVPTKKFFLVLSQRYLVLNVQNTDWTNYSSFLLILYIIDAPLFLLAKLVWSGLVWSGLVWSGLVWSGLVWSGLVLIRILVPSHSIASVEGDGGLSRCAYNHILLFNTSVEFNIRNLLEHHQGK